MIQEKPELNFYYGFKEPSSVLCDPSAWPYPVDGSLCNAANDIANLLFMSPADSENETERCSWKIREYLLKNGVFDPHVRVLRFQSPTYGELFNRIDSALSSENSTFSHIGMALTPGIDSDPQAVLLLAERLINPEPFPFRVDPGAGIRISAELNRNISSPVAWLGLQNGPVLSVDLQVRDSSFSLNTGPLPPGLHYIEVLVETDEGPEVALLAPVRAGSGNTGFFSEFKSASIRDGANPVAAIYQAINDHRNRLGLKRIERNPSLERLANRKAGLIYQRRKPVHLPAPSEDAALQLSGSGYAYSWAAENLSTGPSPHDAFLGLLYSPAHRRILEYPDAVQAGAGIKAENDRVWLAVIMAEPMRSRPSLPFSGSALHHEINLLYSAEDAIRNIRRKAGLSASVRDPELDDLAKELAEFLSENDLPSHSGMQSQTRKAALSLYGLLEDNATASVDIVVGASPEDISNAPAATQRPCQRLGIGISAAASRRFNGERLWLTAICIHTGR